MKLPAHLGNGRMRQLVAHCGYAQAPGAPGGNARTTTWQSCPDIIIQHDSYLYTPTILSETFQTLLSPP